MRRNVLVAVTAAVAALLVSNLLGSAVAEHTPADKVSVASSEMEEMTALVVDGSESQTVDLFSVQMRTSSPADLVIQATSECALVTDLFNVGNSDESAVAQVKMWVEIDGDRVPIAAADQSRGEVVFCNRAFRSVITDLDDEDAKFDKYLRTRAANAFNWIALDVGSGVHEIVVKAQLEATSTSGGQAQATVGNRTLTIEPTHLVNDATL